MIREGLTLRSADTHKPTKVQATATRSLNEYRQAQAAKLRDPSYGRSRIAGAFGSDHRIRVVSSSLHFPLPSMLNNGRKIGVLRLPTQLLTS